LQKKDVTGNIMVDTEDYIDDEGREREKQFEEKVRKCIEMQRRQREQAETKAKAVAARIYPQ